MKKLLLLLLIFLLSGCSKINLGASSDISSLALTNKYNLATEIKSKYALENTALKMVAKNDPKDMVRVTVGNETTGLGAESEFVPSVKISRWDEVSLKLTPKGLDKIDSKDKKVSFEGNKIKYETPKQNFELYDLPISEDLSEGGFEFEWILKEKPATNKIEFNLETEGLKFEKQLPINEEIGQDGIITATETQGFDKDGKLIAWRNENTVGAYVVYASENKINYINNKEYKTGQIGIIYRPLIEDSNGWKIWGKLFIDKENEILSVEIPQNFLDKAVYPIKHAAGLTFGYETEGTAATATWRSSSVVTASMVDSYTASSGDTITGFTIFGINADVDGTSKNLAVAAYTVVTGNPTSRLASKVDISVGGSTYDWYSVSGLSQSMVAGSTYCIAVSGEDYTGTLGIGIKYNNGTAPGRFNSTNTTLQATFGVTGTDSGRHYSIYATYTAGGGGATYCGHTGGDWYVNSTCWISANTTTPGNVYIGTGGSLNCNNGAIISARSRSVGNGGSYSIGNSGGNCGWSLWTPQ
jgi:hypothetical protein